MSLFSSKLFSLSVFVLAFRINFCSLSLFDYFSYFLYFVSRYERLKFSYILCHSIICPFLIFIVCLVAAIPLPRFIVILIIFLVYRLYRLSKKILVDSLLAITIINKTQRQQNVVLLWNHVSNSKYNHKKIRILAIGEKLQLVLFINKTKHGEWIDPFKTSNI